MTMGRIFELMRAYNHEVQKNKGLKRRLQRLKRKYNREKQAEYNDDVTHDVDECVHDDGLNVGVEASYEEDDHDNQKDTNDIDEDCKHDDTVESTHDDGVDVHTYTMKSEDLRNLMVYQ